MTSHPAPPGPEIVRNFEPVCPYIRVVCRVGCACPLKIVPSLPPVVGFLIQMFIPAVLPVNVRSFNSNGELGIRNV